MKAVQQYFSLIKFSHTVFALPFALIGFFLAVREMAGKADTEFYSLSLTSKGFWQTNGSIFLLVLLCMVFARSAAMAFNRYLDRHIDARNPRTAIREIPAGIIKADHALLFTVFMSLLFIICCWFINFLCFCLSFVALFVILFYSYTKRFTALCHLVLGVGLSLAPIGAYIAVTGAFATLPLLFSVVVLCWVSGFDIIYALQDEEFDKANQLNSIPAALGKAKALKVSEGLHLLAAVAVIAAGWLGGFSWWYWIGTAFFNGMLVYQHAIVKPNDLHRVNIAFMTANGIAAVVFAVFVITDIIR